MFSLILRYADDSKQSVDDCQWLSGELSLDFLRYFLRSVCVCVYRMPPTRRRVIPVCSDGVNDTVNALGNPSTQVCVAVCVYFVRFVAQLSSSSAFSTNRSFTHDLLTSTDVCLLRPHNTTAAVCAGGNIHECTHEVAAVVVQW